MTTDAPDYARRRDVERLFKASAPALPEGLREETQRVAARLFGLGPGESGPVAPGEHLGPYRIVRVLGLGGQAFVYEAEHTQLGRRVALKVPRAEVAERLMNEARLAARLEHPRMVRVENVREDEGPAGTIAYLVMENCPGGSLDALLEHHPEGLPVEEVRRVALAVLEALAFAHAKGVVHRDVKPANVLFDADGQPKLADLGIGTLATGGQDLQHSVDVSRLTRDGVVGTPQFMAPEQAAPQKLAGERIDGRADLFSFGKMLFVMLTGASPTTIRPVSRLRPELDPAWDDLVFALVEEDRERRPASAGEVLTTLRQLPGDEPAPRVVVQPAEPAAESPEVVIRPRDGAPAAIRVRASSGSQPVPQGYLVPKGRRWALRILTLCSLFAAGFAGWMGVLALTVRNGTRRYFGADYMMELSPRMLGQEYAILALGAGLAAIILWLFRRLERKAGRSLGFFGALLAGVPLVAWQPLAWAGRFRGTGFRKLFWISHQRFMENGAGLVVATLVLGFFMWLFLRRRRRFLLDPPPPAPPAGPAGKAPGAGGIVLRILGMVAGALTVAGSVILAAVCVFVAFLVALLQGCAEGAGLDVAVTGSGLQLHWLGAWAGALLGVLVLLGCLISLIRALVARHRARRAPPPTRVEHSAV